MGDKKPGRGPKKGAKNKKPQLDISQENVTKK
ncbi:MAG: hypothetical protein K0R55_2945 [Sporomusa sp.]|nr:hypothetical protein [Sporomusa sp.]